jgi:hypothetical protein
MTKPFEIGDIVNDIRIVSIDYVEFEIILGYDKIEHGYISRFLSEQQDYIGTTPHRFYELISEGFRD